MDTICEQIYINCGGSMKQVHNLSSKMLQFVYLFIKDELMIGDEQIKNTNLDVYMKMAKSKYYTELYLKKRYKSRLIQHKRMELRSNLNNKLCTYSYTPLRDVVEKFAEENAEWLLPKLEMETVKSNTLSEYNEILDGASLQRCRGKIKLDFYLDDAELNRGCGFGRSAKLIQLYLSFGDIPLRLKAKDDSIEELLLCDRKQFKKLKLPFGCLFSIVNQDLNELITNGLIVSLNSVDRKIDVEFCTFPGDNAAQYEALGFKCSFRPRDTYCRGCGLRGFDPSIEDQTKSIRSYQNIELQMPLIQNIPENELTVGVKQEMIFITKNITRWNCAPNDVVYLLAEGVLPKELSICLHLIAKTYKKSSQMIKECLTAFPFYHGEMEWKAGDVFALKGTASQVSFVYNLIFHIVIHISFRN